MGPGALQGKNGFMNCENIPEQIDADQLAKCHMCRHISGSKRWCCKHGFTVELGIVRQAMPELPGTLTMARNLAGATVRHVANGLKVRPPELVEKLMQICRRCEMSVEIDGQLRCKDCGCYMARKVKWESEFCRLGYWDEVLSIFAEISSLL